MLETSDYLKDDCLKINCTVGVVVSAMNCFRLHSIQVPESDIGQHFGALLDNQEGSDVGFSVAGEKFHAHKLVLAARSPVFRAQFFEELQEEDTNEIVINDLEPKVFKVRFFWNAIFSYCGSSLLLAHPCDWYRSFFLYSSDTFLDLLSMLGRLCYILYTRTL